MDKYIGHESYFIFKKKMLEQGEWNDIRLLLYTVY